MEILSDATFKGKVIINEGLFIGNDTTEFSIIKGYTTVFNELGFHGDGNTRISKWSDLNSILSFAPASLSTTVCSNTSKINSACSTISSLCTKVNSLCNTVSNIGLGRKYAFGNPTLPAGCTKFYFVDNYNNGRRELYKFLKGDNIYNPSTAKVLKGGFDGPNEEVQMDIKQYFCSFGSTARWFEATLASNTSGVVETEFILLFDEFQEMCTTEKVPQ